MQQIITIGNISDGKTQSRTVYMADGICPTLCSGMDHGNTIPYVIEIKGVDKVNEQNTIAKSRAEQRLGCLNGFGGGSFAGQVYEKDGLAPTLTDMQGGGRQPHIVETQRIICAMRGRNKENPSDRTRGIELEQRLEPQEDGICNTLTSVQKDNLVLETSAIIYDDYNSTIPEDQDATPTLTTNCGSSATRNGVKIIEAKVLQAVDPKWHDFIYNIDGEYWLIRIRKLLPLECWRLMSFTDDDFHKAEQVVSNTQLYKQAGNSIVVNCLEGIFRRLIE